MALAGISDKCTNRGVTQFTELLSSWSGSQGYCMYACFTFHFSCFTFINLSNQSIESCLNFWVTACNSYSLLDIFLKWFTSYCVLFTYLLSGTQHLMFSNNVQRARYLFIAFLITFDHVLASLSRKTYYKFFLLSLFHPREIGDGAWDSWTMPLFQQVTLG